MLNSFIIEKNIALKNGGFIYANEYNKIYFKISKTAESIYHSNHATKGGVIMSEKVNKIKFLVLDKGPLLWYNNSCSK